MFIHLSSKISGSYIVLSNMFITIPIFHMLFLTCLFGSSIIVLSDCSNQPTFTCVWFVISVSSLHLLVGNDAYYLILCLVHWYDLPFLCEWFKSLLELVLNNLFSLYLNEVLNQRVDKFQKKKIKKIRKKMQKIKR